MKRQSQRQQLVSEYFDNGCLDLDAVLDALIDGSPECRLDETGSATSVDIRIEEKRHKILALMELNAASAIAKDAIRMGWFTEDQIDELLRIWTEEARRSAQDSTNSAGRTSKTNRWRDLSGYHNGARPRILPIHRLVA